jgi:hypothetical protein
VAIEYMNAVRYLCDLESCDYVFTTNHMWCSEEEIMDREPNSAAAQALARWRTRVVYMGYVDPQEEPNRTPLHTLRFCSVKCLDTYDVIRKDDDDQ